MSTTTTRFRSVRDFGSDAGNMIARQFETICRKLLQGPNVTANPQFLRYITHEPHPFGNFAVVSNPANCDHTRAAIEPLLSLAQPTAIVFPGQLSSDVEALALASGYGLAEAMPAMAVHIESIPQPPLPDGYELVEIRSLDEDAAWCEAFAAGYGIPRRVADDFGPRAAGDTFASGTIRYFAIKHGEAIVCTSVIFLEGGAAGVYCVSTLPEHRGRGLGAFATACPLQQVQSLGYQTGILQSSAMGESVYKRLGFQQFGAMALFVRMPAESAAAH